MISDVPCVGQLNASASIFLSFSAGTGNFSMEILEEKIEAEIEPNRSISSSKFPSRLGNWFIRLNTATT